MENKTLTRNQKRQIERIEKEAERTHALLSEQFLTAFVESPDPEGDGIKDLYKAINAKWKAYCKIKRFGEKAFSAVETSMNLVIKEYNEAKSK